MIVKYCKASAMALIAAFYLPTLWAATPQLEIIADRTELRSFDKTHVTFAFSEEPQGFDIYDIGVTNGFLSNLVPGGSSNNWVYIAEFTKGAMGTIEDIENSTVGSISQITVADGAYTNTFGEAGTGATEDIAYNITLDGDGLVGEGECLLTRYTRTAADAVTVVGNDGNDFSMSTSGNITYPSRAPDTNRDNVAILLLNTQNGTIIMNQFASPPIVNPIFWLSGLDHSGMDFTGLVDKNGIPIMEEDIIILKNTEKPGNDELIRDGFVIRDINPDNVVAPPNINSTNGGFVIRGEFNSISYLAEDVAPGRTENDFYVINTNAICDTDGDGIADINDSNNNVALPAADIAVTKSLDTAAPFTVADSIQYTLVVTNNGPDAASNVLVSDTPTNLIIDTVVSTNCNSLPCTITTLANGASETITVTATTPANGSFDNAVSVAADESDPDASNNSDNTGNGGNALPAADVAVTKSLDAAAPFTVGDTIQYTLVVSNSGPDAASDVVVTDTPTNLNITNVSSTNCSSFPCTITTLSNGASETIIVTATIPASGSFDNAVSVAADESDPDASNNSDNTGNGGNALPAADVAVTKSLDAAAPFTVGDTI
ncbi:MAG: DUF11 domain-containing protein, partial [Methylomarinum sp.]|nr:DUF11 domain-containing protein [Methylomarinum sp.]